jgi:hypothetical protein
MTDLRERFDRDLADLRLPPGFENSVLTQGRRLRRRRRAAALGGGIATVVLGAAVSVAVLGGGDGTSTDPGFATDVPSASPQVTGAPPPGWWGMPARRMLSVLEAALPAGVTVAEADLTADGENGPVKAFGSLSGVLDAASGPGAFQVLLYPPQPEPATPTNQGGETPFSDRLRCRGYMTTCEPVLDDAGKVVGRVSTDEQQGTTLYELFLLGPDGGALNLTVMDSSGEKPGYEPPSASAPPLTTAQLVALAQDAAWTSYEPKE